VHIVCAFVGFWSRVGGALGIRAAWAKPVDPSRSLFSPGVFPIGWLPSSLRLTADEATSVSAVWACIQTISTSIASSPWLVYEVNARKRTYLPDDKLTFILNQRSNAEITAIAFREAMLFGALAQGNSYAEIIRDASGRVTGLVPLFPEAMIVERDATTKQLVYKYSDPGGGVLAMPGRDIFHLRGPVSVSGLLGDSIVGRAARGIALAAAAERYSLSYLSNGTMPSGVLKYPQKLDPKSLDRIREQWADRTSGPKAAGKPLILEGGMEWQSLSADPDKAQLGATQSWTVENIARYFNVPLVKLGVAAAAQGYGTNIESLNLEWTRTGLKPWALRLEQEANAKLLAPTPYRETCIEMGWMLRGDQKTQAEADKIRIESGVYTVNEIREELGENSIGKEGDLRFVSSLLTPMTTTLLDIQELAAKEKPAPMPALPAEDPAEADPEEEDDSPREDPVLRQALRQMVLQNLQRLEAKMSSERARMEKLGAKPEDITAKFHKWMAADCGPALELIRAAAKQHGHHVNGEADIALLTAVDAVTSGKPAAAEADRMISALLPEVTA
jgi:HK97 family phage portal protein